MKYIYDILLNFNEMKIYDFYEWNENDGIEYFKKVPLIHVDKVTYNNIAIGNIMMDSLFLEKIHNNGEIYENKVIRRVEYVCVLTDGDSATAILLNSSGKIIMSSKMLLDEEEEAVEIGNTLKEVEINIDAKKEKNEVNNYLTRSESYKILLLHKEIDNLYENKNVIKLKYLYYECSNTIEDDLNILYEYLKRFLTEEWSSKHDNLYNLVRLSYTKSNG
jgi:hypothetical protein